MSSNAAFITLTCGGPVAQQIVRFGVGQTAKVFGVLYGLMGLIFLPIVLLVSLASPNETGFGTGFAIALPFLYGIMGFIFTALACVLYNVVAGWIGGIEVEVSPRGETYTV